MVVNRVKGAEDEKRKLGSHILFAKEVSFKGQDVGSATVSYGISGSR